MTVKDRIETTGVYFTDTHNITVAVMECPDTTGYYMSWHRDLMPSYMDKEFDTFDETLSAMREIAPLRRWRNREN